MAEALRTFRYRALNRAGEAINGELAARDRNSAVSRLQAQGLVPLVAEAAEHGSLAGLLQRDLFGGGRLSPKLLADFMQQLSTLIGAGIPAEQALGILAGHEAAPRTRRVAEELLRRLRNGASLADAMAADAKVFPPIALGMVRAGESSGALEAALARLAEYLRRSADVRESVQSALVYPAILLATAFGSIILILTVVLPQLKPVFAHAHGKQLPFATQMILAASDGLRDWWWALLLVTLVLAYLIRHLLQDPAVQILRDRLLLRTPLLGSGIRRAETARFACTLGSLAGANVALPAALALSQSVLVNTLMADAVARVCKQLKEGGGLADPLAATGVFPELAIQFIRIGEATGRLDEMLLKQADLFDGEVRRLIDRGLAMLVPAITIVLGVVVAGIIASVLTAILSVNDVVL
jgi:general secretion pathway protein F